MAIHIHLPSKRMTKDVDQNDKLRMIKRLATKFGVSESVAKKELEAENWDEEEASVNFKAMKKVADLKIKDASEPTDAEIRAYITLRKDNDKLFAEIEKKEDQGVFVSRELRNKAETGRQKENAIRNEVKQAARNKGLI